jgi:hypothetical protein
MGRNTWAQNPIRDYKKCQDVASGPHVLKLDYGNRSMILERES